jgi:hypothetical protein
MVKTFFLDCADNSHGGEDNIIFGSDDIYDWDMYVEILLIVVM